MTWTDIYKQTKYDDSRFTLQWITENNNNINSKVNQIVMKKE